MEFFSFICRESQIRSDLIGKKTTQRTDERAQPTFAYPSLLEGERQSLEEQADIMSGCMSRSVKHFPRSLAWTSTAPSLERRGPFLLRSSSPKSNVVSPSRAKVRWNSSSSRNGELQKAKSVVGGGHTSISVAALMASALGAGLIVGRKSEGQIDREREYSHAGKFVKPAYASVKDMKSVSCMFFLQFSNGRLESSVNMKNPWTMFGFA